MPVHKISNRKIEIRFSTEAFAVVDIVNKQTGEKYLTNGSHHVKVRTHLETFEPYFLNIVKACTTGDNSIEFIISDEKKMYEAILSVRGLPEQIEFHCKISGKQPIWLAEWELSSLALNKVIIPALGGQSLSSSMPVGSVLTYKYPFWWNAQFLIGARRKGGVWLYTRDQDPSFKMLRVKKYADGFGLVYGFETDAQSDMKKLDVKWFVDGYKGSWRKPVDIHRAWMESAFNLKPYGEHPHYPAWMDDIRFILELWGMGNESPKPHHTFDDMMKRLRAWSKLYSASNTLVYLPGYAERGIDSRTPDYNPSGKLGGHVKFKELIDYAHKLGYRVMIHTNVLAITYTHPLYKKFKRYQVVDVFDRRLGWGLDMDGDWLAEPYFAYMNPGYKAWGDLMTTVLGKLIRDYELDGVFLDQTLLAFNTSKGPNFNKGMRSHVERLQKAFPDVLFGGEGINDYILPALPYVQIHGIDSISEVHALDGQISWRHAHPVSTYLMGRYTRFGAHLLTKHPSSPFFKLQEAAYKKLNVIPALVLYHRDQEMDLPEVRKMIERAGTMNEPT
jgi:hypothetical protein